MKLTKTLAKRAGTLAVATTLGLGMLSPMVTTTAHAGSEGRRNTAIALGAASVYAAVKGKNKYAIGGGVATAYAYKRYKNEKRREQEREDRRNRRYRRWRR